MDGPVKVKIRYKLREVESAIIRLEFLGIQTVIDDDNNITSSLDRPQDVMLEINYHK